MASSSVSEDIALLEPSCIFFYMGGSGACTGIHGCCPTRRAHAWHLTFLLWQWWMVKSTRIGKLEV